jgi:prephenate dehydrogenase
MREKDRLFDTITIFGLGLIGGSLGMALRDRGAAGMVIGYDTDPDTLLTAGETGAIDIGTTDMAEAVKKADVVILSTPVQAFPFLVKEFGPFLRPGTIITDTGSTKRQILREITPILPRSVEFLGGHPMTGSEKGGIMAADKYLFENAVYVITPTKNNSPAAVEKVSAMARAVGSRVVTMSPEEHDTIAAVVSHVPHLTAAGLTAALADVSKTFPFAPVLAAGGFRDTTRVAAGNPDLWQQICFSNRDKIAAALETLIAKITAAKEFLKEGNKEGLYSFLAEAREQRLKIPSGLKGLLPALYEVVITVPDKPGIIGLIGTILGEKGINLIDIEILRVREGEGGTIRLGFQSEYERDNGEKALRDNNIPVKRL